ncbi:PQQ-dependent dehydrogenase, methanol/ethanol family [Roseateles sp. So40a]|uniref:PQQ-dependent dehydrogenase, methanol/ethanol family n=1 Tax=Roseateles sp. So40a TaxID=3400226 RepID=UPI003A87BDCD
MLASVAGLLVLCASAVVDVCAADAPAAVDEKRLVAADTEPGNWMSHGRTYSEQRFSPLKQVDVGNVSRLGLAWSVDLNTNKGQEATPLVIDGVMYVSTAWSMVQAYDAGTGKQLWDFDPQVPRDTLVKGCCDAVNRGVAAWGGKVFVGTLDGRLIAVDAKSGKQVWSTVTVDQSKPYTITGAPRVVKGLVLIGNGGGELGVRGYISAYDAATGEMRWRFYTVPGNPAQGFENAAMKRAAETWTGEWWKLGGGGTVWDSMAYDPKLDLLYIGVGNGSPWNRAIRSPGGGDNLFLSSIVALRPSTGEYVWHYQETPGESWDYTAAQHIIVADLKIDGRMREVLLHAPKNGIFYVIDRRNGQLVSAKPFVPVTWTRGVDMKTGRPIENPDIRFGETGRPVDMMPGPLGAHNWQPMSFNPSARLVYIPAQEVGTKYTPQPDFKPSSMGWNVGTAPGQSSATDVKGYLLAWDPVRQREAWRVPYAGPWNGGTLTTAGNLVFQGTAAGEFVAYNATDGKRLWAAPTQTGVMAAPVTYRVGANQFVAVVVGWGGSFAMTGGKRAAMSGNIRNISRILVYKLGAKQELPPADPLLALELSPPPSQASHEVINRGGELFGRYCVVCHGAGAVSGGAVRDLRASAFLSNPVWFDVVLRGAMKEIGMAAFDPVLTEEDASAIREYVIHRANQDKQAATSPK